MLEEKDLILAYTLHLLYHIPLAFFDLEQFLSVSLTFVTLVFKKDNWLIIL